MENYKRSEAPICPFMTRLNHKEKVFTFLATRTVYLEIAYGLNGDSFLSKRREVHQMNDNGTNFLLLVRDQQHS